MGRALGEFEQLILFALVELEDEAYGASIGRAIEERTGREVSAGAIYTALDRLATRGLVITATAERFPSHVERLVYLCAFAERPGADPGESSSAMAGSLVPSALVPGDDGISTTWVRDGTTASAAMAATRAESTPPDRPTTTSPKPFLDT